MTINRSSGKRCLYLRTAYACTFLGDGYGTFLTFLSIRCGVNALLLLTCSTSTSPNVLQLTIIPARYFRTLHSVGLLAVIVQYSNFFFLMLIYVVRVFVEVNRYISASGVVWIENK